MMKHTIYSEYKNSGTIKIHSNLIWSTGYINRFDLREFAPQFFIIILHILNKQIIQ